jgi:hypothetical protein
MTATAAGPVPGRAALSAGSGADQGSRGSEPEITASAARRSCIDRAIGPFTAINCTTSGGPPRSLAFHHGTRPRDGFRAQIPVHWAGIRSEPAMSLPSPSGDMPVANATASPPEEPPGVSAGFHGFTVAPCNALSVWKRNAKSGRLVRATGMAPAERIRVTTTASAGATLSRKAAAPAVVGLPCTSRFSLTVNGTPCRGPTERPAVMAWSAAAAAAIAWSASDTVMALTAGFTASILARCAPMTSRVLISLAAIRSARSRAPSAHSSFAIAPPRVPSPKLIAPAGSPGLQFIPGGAPN